MKTAARRAAAVLAASCVLCGGLALSPGAALAATPAPHVGTPHVTTPPTTTATTGAATAGTATANSPIASTAQPGHAPAAAHRYKPRAADDGLYGRTNPKTDGVVRQSLAMLAFYGTNMRPANSAIRWLQGQQCADGSFTAYRAQTATPCAPTTPRDTDATALAMQALAGVGGQQPRLLAGLNWLRTQQNADGGWGARPGAPTNATTTSLVVGALAMMGTRPSSVRSPFTEKQAYDALIDMSLPCSASEGAGGFATSPPTPGRRPLADPRATAYALLGGIGKRFVASPVQPGPAPKCDPAGVGRPEGVARNGAAYLAPLLTPEGAHLTTASGAADPSATAQAVLAMCASGYGSSARGALHWLETNGPAWAAKSGPAAYARLIFAAHTAGVDPHHFGGADLLAKLEATGPPAGPKPTPTPKSTASPRPEPTTSPSPTPSEAAMNPAGVSPAADADDSPVLSGGSVWWTSIVLIVLIAVGVVVVSRRSARNRPRD